jgi:hypothetical protein
MAVCFPIQAIPKGPKFSPLIEADAETSVVGRGAKVPVAGSRGWRDAPWSLGSGGDANSPPVVSMRDSMVRGSKGGRRLWSQVQRRSRWSGRGLGEGQERPASSAMKRRTFRLADRGSMPKGSPRAGGDATGNAQRVPLAKVGVVLPRTPCEVRYRRLQGCFGSPR